MKKAIKYGDKVSCKNYGEGIVVAERLPAYPGLERDEIVKKENENRMLVRPNHIIVRFSFSGTMKYNRDGFRLGVNGTPDPTSTLSFI